MRLMIFCCESLRSGAELTSLTEAKAAIDALNEKEVEGRALNVNEARPKPITAEVARTGGSGRSSGLVSRETLGS